MLAGELFLDLGVVQQPAGGRVDRDHLTRPDAALLHNLRVVELDGAHLRAEGKDAVLGEFVAGRAEAVAVEAGAHGGAIGEDEAGGAVPGFVEAGVELVKILELLRHALVAFPRGRHQHGHRPEQVAARKHQRLEGVVQFGRVRAAGLDDGLEQVDVLAPLVGLKLRLAGGHPVYVAAAGVDFPVVAEHPEGLGQGPGRECIG